VTDARFQEKFKGAADLDVVIAMASDAGFDVSKEDFLKFQAAQPVELSDDELEGVTGGGGVTGLDCVFGIIGGVVGAAADARAQSCAEQT
jgi:predicted ribosomally synthesized peptide with nif11-like leader